MVTDAIDRFAQTPRGHAFFAAYDTLIGRWPIDTDIVDLSSRFGTTRVTRCGAAGSAPLLMLPGAGATSAAWWTTASALADRFRVHAVDPLGDAGRSVPAGDPINTTGDLRAWLETVLEGLDAADGPDSSDDRPTRWFIVGHSYGAMVALAAALRNQDRYRRLVLLDPTGCFTRLSAAYLARAVPLLVKPTPAYARRLLTWETRGAELDPVWESLVTAGAAFPTAKTVVPRRPKPIALGRLTLPTTVVLAGNSRAHHVDRVEAAARRVIPDVSVRTVPDATHHTMPMWPADATADAILEGLTH